MKFKDYYRIVENTEINNIVNSLPGFYSGGIPDNLMANMIYHYITQYEDRSKLISKTLQNEPEKYKKYNELYKNLIEQLKTHLLQFGWKPEDDGAWIEWYRNGNHKGIKTNGYTSKRYISIEANDIFDVVKSFSILARNLNKVKTDPQSDVIGFKIPTNFGSMYSHKDNIVIHFYDANAKDQINNAVNDFMSQIGKKEINRSTIGKTDIGKDVGGSSDSMQVANQVVRNLKANQKRFQSMMSNPNLAQTVPTELDNMIKDITKNASHRNI